MLYVLKVRKILGDCLIFFNLPENMTKLFLFQHLEPVSSNKDMDICSLLLTKYHSFSAQKQKHETLNALKQVNIILLFHLVPVSFQQKYLFVVLTYSLLILTGELQFKDHSSLQRENDFPVQCIILPRCLILPRLTFKISLS